MILNIWYCFLSVNECSTWGVWDIWFSDRGVIVSRCPGGFLLVSIFFWNWEKQFDLVQNLSITYKLRRKFSKWLLMRAWTGLKIHPPENFGLVVPIVVCKVHQSWNRRGLIVAMISLVVSMVTWCVKPGFQNMVAGTHSRGTHVTNTRTYIPGLYPPGRRCIFT